MPRRKTSLSKEVCNHCGGLIRYYHGSDSCLMCGREIGHKCTDCQCVEKIIRVRKIFH